MDLPSFLSPVLTFIKAGALKLSMLDGKPGLSRGDFDVIVGWVKDQEYESQAPGPMKHRAVVDQVLATFGVKLSPVNTWVVHIIVWAAYQYAQRKGLIA